MCKIIVGNKCDCSDKERQVSYDEGVKMAQKYGVQFIETSAKENINIGEIFDGIGKDIKKKLVES